MTYLQLCKAVRAKLGLGSGPSTTINQTGRLADIVAAVSQAWIDIQLSSDHWRFLRVPAQAVNTTPALALYDYVKWPSLLTLKTLNAIRYAADNKPLIEMDYDLYLQQYSKTGGTGAPTHYILDLEDRVILYPTPDIDYALELDYYKRPQVLSANTDVPMIPDEYHQSIKWRALFTLASDFADDVVYSESVGEYNSAISLLQGRYLPKMKIGSSLFSKNG